MKTGIMAEEEAIRIKIMAEEATGIIEAEVTAEIAVAIKVISSVTTVATGVRTTASSTTTNRTTTTTTSPGNHIVNNKVSLHDLGSSNKITTTNSTSNSRINSRTRRNPRRSEERVGAKLFQCCMVFPVLALACEAELRASVCV